jgi:hypothetical protein
MYNSLKDDLYNLNNQSINSHLKKTLRSEKELAIAYVELQIKTKEKAKVYEKLFTEELKDNIKVNTEKLENNKKEKNIITDDLEYKLNQINAKKEVLILLREKLSFTNI